MASDCKSPRNKKGKGGKERKLQEKTSPRAGRKAERQADRQEDKQTEISFVELSISSDSKSEVDPPLV